MPRALRGPSARGSHSPCTPGRTARRAGVCRAHQGGLRRRRRSPGCSLPEREVLPAPSRRNLHCFVESEKLIRFWVAGGTLEVDLDLPTRAVAHLLSVVASAPTCGSEL